MPDLTREQIRDRINALEALDDVRQAIEELRNTEWEPGESQSVSLQIIDGNVGGHPITFAHGIPASALIEALGVIEKRLAVAAGLEDAHA